MSSRRRGVRLPLRCIFGTFGKCGSTAYLLLGSFRIPIRSVSAGVLRPGASRAADDALRPGEIRTFQISGVSRALVEMAVDAVDTKRAFT